MLLPLWIVLSAGIAAYTIAYWDYDDKGWATLWATTIMILLIMLGLFIDAFRILL